MGYSVFPQAGAGSSIPALKHTVNTSQTVTTNNEGGFVGYAMAIGGGQAGSSGSPNANNSGYGGRGGAGAALMMGPIASDSANVVVVIGAGGVSSGSIGGESAVANLKAFGGSNALADAVSVTALPPQGSGGGNGSGGDSGSIQSNGNIGVSRGGSTQFAAAGGGGGGGGWTWAFNIASTNGGTGSPLTGNGGAGGATKGAGSAGNVPGGGGGGSGSAQYQNPGAGAVGPGAAGRVWIFY